MKKYNDIFIPLILSVIMVVFIWHNFNISGNNIIFIFIFAASYIFFKYTTLIKEKRINIIAAIISLLFTLIEIIGKSINKDYTLNNIINKWIVVNLLGYFIICWSIIKCVYSFLDKVNKKEVKENFFKIKRLNNNYIVFLLFLILIIISWIPYLLKYFPGIITPDSLSQIEQAIGKEKLQNHHPIAHTAIISLCINLGLAITNNINIGIAIYSILSIILMAAFDAIVLTYLRKKNVPFSILFGILIYYMFYPVNALYSITMWKDIIFSGIFPIFLILCNELIFNTEEFLKYKKNIFVYVTIAFLIMVFRHNGVYVVILTLPFLYIVLKKYWKKFSIICVSILTLYTVFNTFVTNVLKAERGSVGEMLSIPLQQIARVEKNYRYELDENITDRINQIYTIDKIGDYYKETISDPVKAKFNEIYLKNNKIDFIKTYISLFLRYPKDYIEAFIANSYGYYYPEAYNWVVSRATMDRDMGIRLEPKTNSKIVETIDSYIDRRDIVLLSMMFSIGFVFWGIIVCLGYKIYIREYKYILVYLPIFILWLTCIASPVFCEFRYAYPLFTSIFLYICFNLKIKNDNIRCSNRFN